MTSHIDIEQNFEMASDRLDELLKVKIERKKSEYSDASVVTTHRDHSILSFVKETCDAEWMLQWASKHPVPTFLFLNKIHDELHHDGLWDIIKKTIQTSDVYQILQANHPAECPKYLNVQPITKLELQDFTVLDFFDPASRFRRMSRGQKKPLAIDDKFSMAASDLQTIKQVWDVRDEARRRLISQELINHDFSIRESAPVLGYNAERALAENVLALFNAPNYKKETITPLIKGWTPQKTHPFQPVIEDLVTLRTLPKVEEQCQKLYASLIKKCSEKCEFETVRMAEYLGISERRLGSYMADLDLENWYAESHKEFLQSKSDKLNAGRGSSIFTSYRIS